MILVSENPLVYDVDGKNVLATHFECTTHSKEHSIDYIFIDGKNTAVGGVGDFESCEDCAKILA